MEYFSSSFGISGVLKWCKTEGLFCWCFGIYHDTFSGVWERDTKSIEDNTYWYYFSWLKYNDNILKKGFSRTVY